MTKVKLRSALVLSVVLVLSLAVAGIAAAESSKQRERFDVVGGKSLLAPDVELFEALADYGVTATPVEGAKANNKGLVFPITGGEVRSDIVGTIEHRGGIKFTNANTGATVTFDDFLVKIGKSKAKLFATTGTDAVRFLNLDLSDSQVDGEQGGALKIKNITALLAKPATAILSEVVGAKINKNAIVGVMKVKAQTQAK